MIARPAIRRDAGFTLVEVMVAWGILMVALVSTFSVFSNSQAETNNAQRRAVMTAVAQREIERIRALPPANVALSATASTAAEGTPTGRAATETRAVDTVKGRVAPGPTPFSMRGMTGRIYRYVTYNSAACSAVSAAVAAQIDVQAGETGASSNLGDLCPAANNTKRVTIVVASDYNDHHTHRPVESSTLMADTATVQVAAAGTGLRVDVTGVQAGTTTQTAAESAYANATNQTLYLYDTQCAAYSVRQSPTSNHSTHNTAEAGKTCNGGGSADLMSTATPGALGQVIDYSSDLVRSPIDGLALKRDPTTGSCSASSSQSYTSTEAGTRKWSLHRWSTKALSATAQTLAANGRATVTLYTHSVGGAAGAGRVCATLRRASDGMVLGTTDYTLASWPTRTTQIDLTFDLASATIASGDRVELLLRTHPSSANDIELLYDRADAPAAVSMTMTQGKTIT